jgi:hypothetical protein
MTLHTSTVVLKQKFPVTATKSWKPVLLPRNLKHVTSYT